MLNTIIGILAGIFCTISFVPQVIKIMKTKETKDLSLLMLSMLVTGVFLWIIYGILLMEAPIILANAITFILVSVILIMKIKYR